jgi:hypothetical protein
MTASRRSAAVIVRFHETAAALGPAPCAVARTLWDTRFSRDHHGAGAI